MTLCQNLLRTIFCIGKGKRSDKEGDFLILAVTVIVILATFLRVAHNTLFFIFLEYGNLISITNDAVFCFDCVLILCCCYVLPRKTFMGLTISFHGMVTTTVNSFASPNWIPSIELFLFFILFAYFSSSTFGLCFIPLIFLLTVLAYMFHFIHLIFGEVTMPIESHIFIDYSTSFLTQMSVMFCLSVVLVWSRYLLAIKFSDQRIYDFQSKKWARLVEKIVNFKVSNEERKKTMKEMNKVNKELKRMTKSMFRLMESYKPFLPEDITHREYVVEEAYGGDEKSKKKLFSQVVKELTSVPTEDLHLEAWDSQEDTLNSLGGSSIYRIEPATIVCIRFALPDGYRDRPDIWHGVLPHIYFCVQEGLKDVREKVKSRQAKVYSQFSFNKIFLIFHSGTSLVNIIEMAEALALIGIEFALCLRDELLELEKEEVVQLAFRKLNFVISVISDGPHFHGVVGVSGTRQVVDFGESYEIASIFTQYGLLETKVDLCQKVVMDRKTEKLIPFHDYLRLPVGIVKFPQFRQKITPVFLLEGRYNPGVSKFTREGGEKEDGAKIPIHLSHRGNSFKKGGRGSLRDEELESLGKLMSQRPRRKEKMTASEISLEEHPFDLVDLLWDLIEENRLDQLSDVFDQFRKKSRQGDDDSTYMIKNLVIVYSICKKMVQTQQSIEDIFGPKGRFGKQRKPVFSLKCIPIVNSVKWKSTGLIDD